MRTVRTSCSSADASSTVVSWYSPTPGRCAMLTMVVSSRRSCSSAAAALARRRPARRWPRPGTAIWACAEARAPKRRAAARRPTAASPSWLLPRRARQPRQADCDERFAHVLVGEGVGRCRVADRGAQRAEREVGALRQEQAAGSSWAGSRCPLPNGQMPAMARNSVVLPQPEVPRTSTRAPSGMSMSASATSVRPLGSARSTWSSSRLPSPASTTTPGVLALLLLRGHDGGVETGQTVDRGFPAGEADVGVDEPGQRSLHLAEGAGDLDQSAERGWRRRSSAARRPGTGRSPRSGCSRCGRS